MYHSLWITGDLQAFLCFERQLIHLTHKPSMSMRGKGDLIHWPPKVDITNKFQEEEKPALNTWVAQEFYVPK